MQWIDSIIVPALVLLIGIFIYSIRVLLKNTIETQFNKALAEYESKIKSKETFKYKVKMDQYDFVTYLIAELNKILVKINLIYKSESNIVNENESIDFTDFMIEFNSKRYLLSDKYYQMFTHEMELIMLFNTVKNDDHYNKIMSEIEIVQKSISEEVINDYIH